MNFVFRIIPAEEHVRIVASGDVSVESCVKLIHQVAANPLMRPHFSILIDARAAAYERIRPADLVKVADTLEAHRSIYAGPIAIQTRGATLLAAEALATLVRVPGHVRMRVFVDLAAAESYCGLHEPAHIARETLTRASVA